MAAQRAAGYAVLWSSSKGGAVTAGPGKDKATPVGRGHLRAWPAGREQMIDALKAAFVQGRLTQDEFDERIGQALAARTDAELAAATVGIPVGPGAARPLRRPPRRQVSNAAVWGASGLLTPVIFAVASVLASLGGGDRYEAAPFVLAFAYFVFWLSVGADLLWQWHGASLPAARMCVRCAHTVASHRARASCTVRSGSLRLWRRCPCAGYVPPGLSPQDADMGSAVATG